MKKEDFYNTMWPVTEWSLDQKEQWQKKMFDLGFKWHDDSTIVKHTMGVKAYYLGQEGYIAKIGVDYSGYAEHYCKFKTFTDVFPVIENQPEGSSENLFNYLKKLTKESGVSIFVSEEEFIVSYEDLDLEFKVNNQEDLDQTLKALKFLHGKNLYI